MILSENFINLTLLLLGFLFLYWITRRWKKVHIIVLLFSSLLFYAWGNFINAVLLFVLIVFDYLIVTVGYSKKHWKPINFYMGLSVNVCVWLAYKYLYDVLPSPFALSYPIGISYFMLRKISFLINQYRRADRADWNLIEYGNYITFFPQILSGPIETPERFLNQLRADKEIRSQMIWRSISLFIFGFVKKIVIADNLGLIVNRVFQLENPSLLMAVSGALGFSVQLYADFSAYTDISRGIAILMGYDPPENFNAPFLATSPQGFWNRWHITLSQWLRIYIFNPTRRKLRRVFPEAPFIHLVVPTLSAMIVSGLWHGNTLNFIIWGLYHAFFLIGFRAIEQWLEKRFPEKKFTFLKWGVTLLGVMVGWLIFRGPSLSWVVDILFNNRMGLIGYELITAVSILSMVFMYSIPLILYRLVQNSGILQKTLLPLYYALSIILLTIFSASGLQDFIYFEF